MTNISTDIVSKFESASKAVSSQFVGRDQEIAAIMAAMVAGQHVFMLGPPGTGKSALGRSIASTLSARFWQYLFSRTTTPDEVFGPLDLKALKESKYERITDGRFADCEVAFTDEIGKANSTVQNSMLTAINERLFDAGRGAESIPLRTVLAASNELPDPKESGAFMDRFLVRLYLDDSATTHNGWLDVVVGNKTAQTVESVLTLEDWDKAIAEAKTVDASGATEALWKVKQDLEAREIVHTARRWKAIVDITKAKAWLAGRNHTTSEDASIAQHCLWRLPNERAPVQETVLEHCTGCLGEAMKIKDGAVELIDSAGSEIGYDEMARIVREVSHAVSQIRALGESECDKMADELEEKSSDIKKKALAQLGL